MFLLFKASCIFYFLLLSRLSNILASSQNVLLMWVCKDFCEHEQQQHDKS